MTISGIITLVVSTGIAWGLFLFCIVRLLKSDGRK